MKKVSYSQYTLWSTCPKAWELKYVHGHKFDDTSIHTIFGTSMHEIIQDWLDTLYNKSETMAKTVYLHDSFKEKLLNLFKENTLLNEHGEKVFLSDKKTLMEFYEQGCKILTFIQNNYKKIFPTTGVKLYGIEVELNAELRPGVNYIGYIDIVTHNTVTNKYVLYDLKTTRTGWTQDQKSDPKKIGQLLLYKRFFSQQFGVPEDNISVEFVMLKRIIPENTSFPIPQVSKFEPPNKTPSMNKAWKSFEAFLDGAFSQTGEYMTEQVASPSKDSCRWCVFRDKPTLCSVAVKK